MVFAEDYAQAPAGKVDDAAGDAAVKELSLGIP